jgi:hypothetical protein
MEKSLKEKINPETIDIPIWWKNGSSSYRRDCLSPSHPEYTYNYMKNIMGVIPEKYGIYHPYIVKYENYSREELMSKIIELEEIINNIERYI